MDTFLTALDGAVAGLGHELERPGRTPEFYRENPALWAWERAEKFLWSKQREAIEALRDNRRVLIQSCHSTGKTLNCAVMAAWWIDVHPPGEAFVLTTAPTGTQVKALLWREIGRLHRKAELPGRINLTEWYLNEELVAFGRKSSDYDDDAFQGVHALRVLVIIDEGCGVKSTIWTAAESVASNKYSKILAVGNPDDNESEFAKKAQSEIWHKIKIGYKDTPNFTGEDVPELLLDSLISREWVDERKQEWGEESALFASKCNGEFPDKGTDALSVIPYGMVSKCKVAEVQEDPGFPVHAAGIDVGGGGDSTVVFQRVGTRAVEHREFKNPDPMATVAEIALCLREWGTRKAKIDVGGIGWGVYGRLRELSTHHGANLLEASHDAEVIGVNFGAKATFQKQFLNKRAELWWNGRELSRLQAWDLSQIPDEVIAQLTSPRYKILDSKGRIQVEAKAEVIKRLGRSPDLADALLLAFYDGPAHLMMDQGGQDLDISALDIFANERLTGTGRVDPERSSNPFNATRRLL